MAYKISNDRQCPLVIVALAGIFHLLLLCVPFAFLNEGIHNLTNPRIVVFLLVVSAWCFVESMASAGEQRLPMKSHGPQHLPLAIGLFLLITFWVSLADSALFVSTPFGAVAVVGALAMVVGIVLRYLSLRTLGAFFLNEVAMMPGQPLVTGGVYGLLRHPSEAGTICLAFGGAIVLGSTYGLMAGALLLLPCVIWRTRLEDRMLRDHDPVGFGLYRREVSAFLPRIRLTSRSAAATVGRKINK